MKATAGQAFAIILLIGFLGILTLVIFDDRFADDLLAGMRGEQDTTPVRDQQIIEDLQEFIKDTYNDTADSNSIFLREFELQIHDLINVERAKFGLKKLRWNTEIAKSSRKHSEWQASLNVGQVDDLFIEHVNDKNESHGDRLQNDEIYYYSKSAENIFAISIVKSYFVISGQPAEYFTQTEMAEKSVKGWMDSPGHRVNILTQDYEEAGIGIATDPTETNYIITQVFIERASCGFKEGPCCEKRGYYPFCFVPLECTSGVCV